MSTLRVDSIQGRTGSQVTIPSGTTLNVDGSLDVAGGVNYTGGITVGGVTQPVGYAASVIGGEVNNYTENGYQYESRTFWNDGTLTVNSKIRVDFMIVGGGGAGGMFHSTNGNGGGGSGGVVIGRGVDLPAGNYYIRVGRGGKGRGYYPGGFGERGLPSYIEGPPAAPLPYVADGGGGGSTEGGFNSSYQRIDVRGGSGGGAAQGYRLPTNPTYLGGQWNPTQAGYDPSPMPITAFNNTPYMNTGIVKGYGNEGGNNANTWTGAGGGGAGGAGGSAPTASPGQGWGGVGVAVPWRTGSAEYIAGGGGGGGNSSEVAGNGRYGGGRGSGSTPTQPYTNMVVGQEPLGNGAGSKELDAIIGTGAGGGAGSYHNGPSYGHPNFGGNGAPGRVMIRWRLT